MARTRFLGVLVLVPWLLVGASAQAESSNSALSFTPHLMSIDYRKNERDELQEARFNSGLGLQIQHQLIQFAVDYKVQVQLKDQADDASLSQQLGAMLYSDALNRMLGVKADVRAGSTIRQAGDAWAYSITPAISKSFSDLATFSAQYQYSLDHADARMPEKEKSGYRLGLSGKAQEGRLSWKGNYGSTDVFGNAWQLQSTELLELESRYQLMPDLRLEITARNRNETVYSGGLAHDFLNETRYDAGLSWSPSQYYSMAFKVNKRRDSHKNNEDVFGSGNFSWFPNRELEFTLSYGDHLVGGVRALMLSTNIDLSGS